MPGSVSRDTFDKTKNYKRVLFIEDRKVLDAELNEAQQIQDWQRKRVIAALTGNVTADDELAGAVVGLTTGDFVDAGGTNQIGVIPGFVLSGGDVVLPSGRTYLADPVGFDTLVVFDGTETAGDTAVAYYDVYDEEVDSVTDPDIIDPIVGSETAIRVKLKCDLAFVKGTGVVNPPVPPAGHFYIKLGVVTYNAGHLTALDWVQGFASRVLTASDIDVKADSALLAAAQAEADAAAAVSAAAGAQTAATAASDAAAAALLKAEAADESRSADVTRSSTTLGSHVVVSQTVAFVGVVPGDVVDIGHPTEFGDVSDASQIGLIHVYGIAYTDQVKLKFCNANDGPLVLPAGTWKARVTKPSTSWP